MLRRILGATALVACLGAAAQAADGVPARLETARQAYAKGDLFRAAGQLEAALMELQTRLGKSLAEAMPPAPPGWEADPAEIQGLGAVGGGLAVTRAYSGKDATLNASLIVDSPAVDAAAALIANPAATAAQPNMKHLKVAGEDALSRWDGSTRSGEVTIVLGNRVLLELQGDNLQSGDQLVEAAKGWNIAAIRKAAGL